MDLSTVTRAPFSSGLLPTFFLSFSFAEFLLSNLSVLSYLFFSTLEIIRSHCFKYYLCASTQLASLLLFFKLARYNLALGPLLWLYSSSRMLFLKASTRLTLTILHALSKCCQLGGGLLNQEVRPTPSFITPNPLILL